MWLFVAFGEAKRGQMRYHVETMSHEIQTLLMALLPSTSTIHLTNVSIEEDRIRIQLTAMTPTANCPPCAAPASSIHSRYQRHLTDVPWGTLHVHIQLAVRKFVCRNQDCVRHIFTERLPDLVESYARKTTRLVTALRQIGLALGGQAGARLATRLRYPTSPATLRRLVRRAPLPAAPAPTAVGIDEWAWRPGHQYGTILVNLTDHRVVDLLPDRSADSVALWLAQHPTISVVCRDRSDLYADGIRRGAPDAVQVLDRFHLVQNLREAVESLLVNARPALQHAAERTAHVLAPAVGAVPVTPMYRGRRNSPQNWQQRLATECH
jgi:transposase